MKTLRSMLLMCAGTLAISTAVAQTQSAMEGSWTIGPKIGLNASSFSSKAADHRLGPAAGITFSYDYNERNGITGDVLYSFKGGEQETKSGSVSTKRSTELSYIEIPVQGMYYFREGMRFRPKLGIGPYAAVLLDADEVVKTEIDRDGPDAGTEDETDVSTYGTFDWGVVGTTGFKCELRDDTWLNVDLRYGHGFSDIADENGEVDIKNRSWALQVGLGLPLNRQ